jgi:hypothetical protein
MLMPAGSCVLNVVVQESDVPVTGDWLAQERLGAFAVNPAESAAASAPKSYVPSPKCAKSLVAPRVLCSIEAVVWKPEAPAAP